MSKKRLRCPTCGKLGVTHRRCPHGGDFWGCRYCSFTAWDAEAGDRPLRNYIYWMNADAEERGVLAPPCEDDR